MMRQGKRTASAQSSCEAGSEVERTTWRVGFGLKLLKGRKIERPLSAALVVGMLPKLEEIDKRRKKYFRGAASADVERTCAVIGKIRNHQDAGHGAHAVKIGAKLLGNLERKYGCEHPILAPVLFECATAQAAIGDMRKAEALHLQVCWVIEGAYGAISCEIVSALHTLSIFYIESGMQQKASTVLSTVRMITGRLQVDENLLAKTEAIAGRQAKASGKTSNAIRCFIQAEQHFAACGGRYVKERAKLRRLIAECLCELGQPERAAAELVQALELVIRKDGACFPSAASRIYLDLSRLTARTSSYEDACIFAQKAEKAARIGCGAISRQRAECLANLGALYNRVCSYENAVWALEEALAVFDQIGPSDPIMIADIYDLLFDVFQAQGKAAEAQTYLILSRAARRTLADLESTQERIVH